MFFAPSKSRYRAKIWVIGISKTSDHIQIRIKMPNPCQEPQASSKAPNEDLKDMDVLCQRPVTISKSRSRSQPPSGTTTPNKIPNQDLKDMDVLCTFEIKIEGQNSEQQLSKTSDHIHIGAKIQTPVRNLQYAPNP